MARFTSHHIREALCEGFNPVVITPETGGTVREVYNAENIDRL